MGDLLNRFSFSDPKWNLQIAACMIIIWLALVICTLSSLSSQGFTRRQRLFWILIITGIPLLGILIYLPFSIRLDNYPTLKMLRKELK